MLTTARISLSQKFQDERHFPTTRSYIVGFQFAGAIFLGLSSVKSMIEREVRSGRGELM
jgi:hypothetical protein